MSIELYYDSRAGVMWNPDGIEIPIRAKCAGRPATQRFQHVADEVQKQLRDLSHGLGEAFAALPESKEAYRLRELLDRAGQERLALSREEDAVHAGIQQEILAGRDVEAARWAKLATARAKLAVAKSKCDTLAAANDEADRAAARACRLESHRYRDAAVAQVEAAQKAAGDAAESALWDFITTAMIANKVLLTLRDSPQYSPRLLPGDVVEPVEPVEEPAPFEATPDQKFFGTGVARTLLSTGTPR